MWIYFQKFRFVLCKLGFIGFCEFPSGFFFIHSWLYLHFCDFFCDPSDFFSYPSFLFVIPQTFSLIPQLFGGLFLVEWLCPRYAVTLALYKRVPQKIIEGTPTASNHRGQMRDKGKHDIQQDPQIRIGIHLGYFSALVSCTRAIGSSGSGTNGAHDCRLRFANVEVLSKLSSESLASLKE